MLCFADYSSEDSSDERSIDSMDNGSLNNPAMSPVEIVPIGQVTPVSHHMEGCDKTKPPSSQLILLCAFFLTSFSCFFNWLIVSFSICSKEKMKSQGIFLNKEGKKFKCVFFVAPKMKSVGIS